MKVVSCKVFTLNYKKGDYMKGKLKPIEWFLENGWEEGEKVLYRPENAGELLRYFRECLLLRRSGSANTYNQH